MGSTRDRATADLIRRERAVFDAWAEQHGEFRPLAERAWQTLRNRLVSWIGESTRSLRILDIGCGSGSSLALYEPLAEAYTGLDLSPKLVALAAAEHPRHTWLVGNAQQLPFDSESFDLVGLSSVLHHLPDRSLALAEAYRVLRPGGRLFAFDPHLFHPAFAVFRWPRSPFYQPLGISPTESPLTRQLLREALLAAGFEQVRIRAQSDLPYRQVMVPWMNTLLPAYNLCDWCWEHCGAGRWFGLFLCSYACKPGPASSQGGA